MALPRFIPILLIRDTVLVKGKKFKDHRYIGDPINAIRIFNDFQVDELVVLDISATAKGESIALELVRTFSGECFMPLAVGGGIKDVEHARDLLRSGAEKVIINSAFFDAPGIVAQLSREFGAQSVVVSIDYARTGFLKKKTNVLTHSGAINTNLSPLDVAKQAEQQGAGEIMLTNIDLEGSYDGYDIDTLQEVSAQVSIPIIINGGAKTAEHLTTAIKHGASASAAGSMFVFHGAREAVLISHPERSTLDQLLAS